jgi:hypothetical protein
MEIIVVVRSYCRSSVSRCPRAGHVMNNVQLFLIVTNLKYESNSEWKIWCELGI